MESHGIDNDHLKVSSSAKDKDYGKISARLNFEYAWRSLKSVYGEYVEADLGQMTKVTGVALQGDPKVDHRVTRAKVTYAVSYDYWIGAEVRGNWNKHFYFPSKIDCFLLSIVAYLQQYCK